MLKNSTMTGAVAQLRQLAEPYRLRVQADAEGFPVIPGRYGQIEWFDGQDLAVYSNHPRLFAAVIKARRKRTLSPEAAWKLGARTAYRATSGH
jgi:hypothetical protein